jgi:glycosyltransferase involved in cell wall biosynthesis
MREGDVRQGAPGRDLHAEDGSALLAAWLDAVDLGVSGPRLIELLQEGELAHRDVYRRACRIHERKLANSVRALFEAAERPAAFNPHEVALELFDACVPGIPYAAAAAFLGREKLKLPRSDADLPRIALITEGLGSTHGVSHTIRQLREHGVPGFDVEVVGTDAGVDRRLPAVAEVEIPFYPGLTVGVPSLPSVVDTLAEGRYDMIHLATPGPTGIAAWLFARVLDVPLIGSYHTELAAYAVLRSGQAQLEALAKFMLGAFYGACALVLSPSPATDDGLQTIGIPGERIRRWVRGVDLERFDRTLRQRDKMPGEVSVLYAGRLSKEKGIDLLADAFLAARRRDPRLHLVLAGGGPEEAHLRERLGPNASFLGWLAGDELARAYASSDALLFASHTDTYGQVIVEAQASGLPVVAVAEGGPASLIEPGKTGLLAPASADDLADALLRVVSEPLLRARLRRAAREAVSGRTWPAALRQLADGYREVLDGAAQRRGREAA